MIGLLSKRTAVNRPAASGVAAAPGDSLCLQPQSTAIPITPRLAMREIPTPGFYLSLGRIGCQAGLFGLARVAESLADGG
jgi:hypothetical protein